MKRDLHAATIANPIQNSTRRRRDSDRGDTLVEVLIALVILGLAAVALLVAFATSMSASAEHRNIATYNEVLSTASQAVISAYQTTPSLFQCPVTYPNPTLPSPYSADTVTFGTGASVVQYWNGGAFQPGCLANVPEKITIGVTGIPSRYTNTFVVTLLSSSSATANTGTATSIAFSQAPAPTGGATSGVPLTNLSEPIIEILVNGAPDSNDLSPVNFTLTAQAGSPSATLSGCSGTPGTPSPGFVTFAGCTVTTNNNAAGYYSLTATTPPTVSSPSGLTATSGFFQVSAASYFLSFTHGGGVQPSGGISGLGFATTPKVAVVNSSGTIDNSWSGTITFSVSGGILTCPGSVSTTSVTVTISTGLAALPSGCTFAGGYYYNPISQVTLATPYTLTASAIGTLPAVPATSNTFAVSSFGTATQLAFSAQPSGVDSLTGTTVFPGQPAVTVEDSFGNIVTTDNSNSNPPNPVTLSISGGQTLGGCSSNWSNGVDTFTGCHGSAFATGLTLTATSTGLTSATSTSFNITGVATHLVFETQPQAGVSGATLTTEPVVAFEDSANQVVTSSTSAITLTPTGGTLSCAPDWSPLRAWRQWRIARLPVWLVLPIP